MKFLANAFLFLSMIPFVAPIPLAATDIQYPIFVISFILFLRLMLDDGLKLDVIDCLFLLFVVLSIFYVNPYIDFDYTVRKQFLLLLAFVLFFLARRLSSYFTLDVYFYAVLINFVAAVFHFLNPLYFASTLGQFIRIVKITDFGDVRGVSGFCPEPGFLGAMAIYFMLLGMFFYLQGIRSWKLVFAFILSMLVIILTKSGTGYLYVLLMLFFLGVSYYKGWRRFIFLLLPVILIFGVVNLNMDTPNRGINIIQKAVNNPSELINDKSIMKRVGSIEVGLRTLMEHPMGVGVGTFDVVVADLGANVGMLSALSRMVVEMGVLFLLFVAMLWFCPINSSISGAFKGIAFMFLLASFSIAFPPTWILMGLLFSKITISPSFNLVLVPSKRA